jgi:hypothetical protein
VLDELDADDRRRRAWFSSRIWPASRSVPRRSPNCSTAPADATDRRHPAPVRPVVDLESGSGLESVYRMRLELPQVDPGALTLGRVDDDLIVGAGGLRRRVRLASVLRRCIVVDAHLRGSELTVRFRPDPEVWPA